MHWLCTYMSVAAETVEVWYGYGQVIQVRTLYACALNFGHTPYFKSCACVIVHRAGLERSVRELIAFCVQGS